MSKMFIGKQFPNSYLLLLASNLLAFCLVNGVPIQKLPWQEHYERMFELDDLDKDGGLSFTELMAQKNEGWRCFNDIVQYLKANAKTLDSNNDMALSIKELAAAGNATLVPVDNQKNLEKFYYFFDANLDGQITPSDIENFEQIFASMRKRFDSEPEMHVEFELGDTNGDGKLQLDEMYASLASFKLGKEGNPKVDLGTELEGIMKCHEK